MATSLDTMVNSTTITVDGTAISLAGIDEKLRGVLLVALCALAQGFGGALSAGKSYGIDVGGAGGSGVRIRVAITPSAS